MREGEPDRGHIEWDEMSLTNKQKVFCAEYLKDLNATQAAIRAGYSKKTARNIASEYLAKPNIQKRIKKLMEERSERTKINQDMVLKELAIIGFSDIKDICEIEEGGMIVLKTFEKIAEEKTKSIKAIKEDRIIRETAKGDEMVVHDKVRYELWDKPKCLELIGKHLGMFTDKIEHSGHIDSKLTIEVVKTK